jgi:hypothetical protein
VCLCKAMFISSYPESKILKLHYDNKTECTVTNVSYKFGCRHLHTLCQLSCSSNLIRFKKNGKCPKYSKHS